MIANLSQKLNLRTSAIALSLTCLLLEVYVYTFPIISGIALVVYVAMLGKAIGERLFSEPGIQWWGGIATVLSTITLVCAVVYYPYKITPEVSIIGILTPLLFLLKKKKQQIVENKIEKQKKPGLFVYIFLLLEIILLSTIVSARNGELMQSPWLAFPAWFFILFGIATTCFVYCIYKKNNPTILLIGAISHFFIFYSIAAIVYKLGYGFDGFIHRATESWILEHGFISPKEPFYIGQYGLIVTLSRITGIAIKYIDIFLVPILASISIPTLLYITLPRAWNTTRNIALALSLYVPFIFFLTFNLTTPHNLALLLTVLTILALVGYWYRLYPLTLPGTLGVIALMTHPLLGVPVLILCMAVAGLKHTESDRSSIIFISGAAGMLALAPLLMFSFQQWLNGYGLPTLVNPFSNVELFLEFFKRPFWYEERASTILEIIYAWQYILTPAIIILSLIGFWFLKKSKLARLLIASSLGLFAGAFLLRTLITFPNVSFHEQGNYPLRLLVGSIAILIPLGMYGVFSLAGEKIEFLSKKLKIKKNTLYALGILKIGILLMFSLYFSYPQVNAKVYFPGFNVTEYDKQVIEYIHKENPKYDYAVLSTILTAVTALTEYPFAHYFETAVGPQFYYAIPSGGPLQLAFEDMMYHGQKRETIDEVFELTNARAVYVVVPWYWGNADSIIEGAKKSADSWHSIEDKMWIFKYQK